ncbi:unnamed protein product [Merluccius merluccius]
MEDFGGTRVKEERRDVEEGAYGWSGTASGYERAAREAKKSRRETVVEIAHKSSMTPSFTRHSNPLSTGEREQREVNSVHLPASVTSVKTPKYSGSPYDGRGQGPESAGSVDSQGIWLESALKSARLRETAPGPHRGEYADSTPFPYLPASLHSRR